MKRTALAFISVLAFAAAWAADEGLKTHITGGAMDIRKGGDEIVFTNGAVITRGDSVLKADRVVQDKKNGAVEAFGGVNFRMYTSEHELLLGKGERARYNSEMSVGQLSGGRAKLDYFVKKATAPVEMEADTIDFDRVKEEILGQGDVVIITSSGTATAPRALFEQKGKRMVLTGGERQATLVYGQQSSKDKGKYWADKITFMMNEQKILLEGGVKGRFAAKKTGGNGK